MTIVGGEPKGWNPDGGTPGGALGALGDEEGAACQTEKDSLSADGIQWVLGGESQIDASGATVELCAQASAPESGDQQISVYSQLTGETASPQSTRASNPVTPSTSTAPRGPPIPRARRSGSTPLHHRRRSRRPRSSARRSPTARRRSPSPASASARSREAPASTASRCRVSHRELVAATPPPNPADLASLKLQVTNGLGQPRARVQDLTPNFTSDANAAFARARLRHHGVREHDGEARWRLRGVRGDVARRCRRPAGVGAARRHADRRELHAGRRSAGSTAPIRPSGSARAAAS